MSRPKLLALITGILSIFICVIYLFLITIFDFRSFLNDYLTSHPANMEVVLFLRIDYFYS